jgi:hypothetical protein
LLVAKAIVRAVRSQEPNGRFLELHDKKSNIWKEIDYKKAVDKSSQALRERWEESDDDDILQRSMTVMFNKKLELNSQGRASRESVEEAVYFAVMSVALEYAKRWGTEGFSSLTEQLRPIVKSVGNNAIPRPNGPLAKADTRRTDLSVKKSPVTVKTTPIVAANTSTTSTKAASKTSPVARRPSVTDPSSDVIQATLTVPAINVTAAPPAVSVPIHQVASPFRMINPCISPVDKTLMSGSVLATSHSLGSPYPVITLLHRDQENFPSDHDAPQRMSASVVPASSQSIGGFDTFGSPAPLELTARKIDITGEFASIHQEKRNHYLTPSAAAAQVNSKGETPPEIRRSSNGDTFGQRINPTVLNLSRGPVATANGTTLPSNVTQTQPLNSNHNGFNTAKRKLSNIATPEEIEAENEKRPKFHGMSPFHREILKINLQLLVDW